jgi:hypothetical protein
MANLYPVETLRATARQIFGPTTTSADADASCVLLHTFGIRREGILFRSIADIAASLAKKGREDLR